MIIQMVVIMGILTFLRVTYLSSVAIKRHFHATTKHNFFNGAIGNTFLLSVQVAQSTPTTLEVLGS